MEKERKREIWTILGNFGKLGQGNKLEKWGKMAERKRKRNKNLIVTEEEEEKVVSRIRQRLSVN